MYLKSRIKPKLLREQKTEALLLFIKTTLDSFFIETKEKNDFSYLGSKEDRIEINNTIKELHLNLNQTIVSIKDLKQLIDKAQYNNKYRLLLRQEDPLITYYDSITKTLANNLPNGTKWIPELLILALLSEWILEEEKSTFLFPYLNEIKYIELISKYDLAKKELNTEEKNIINDMYTLSSRLIRELKLCKYKLPKKNKR